MGQMKRAPFRLRKFCPAGSWTGNPGLWRNSTAAWAWRILSHSHLQALISGSFEQGISTPPTPEGKCTSLISWAPGTLLQKHVLGLRGTYEPSDVQSQAGLPTVVWGFPGSSPPAMLGMESKHAMMFTQSPWDGWVRPTSSLTARPLSLTQGWHKLSIIFYGCYENVWETLISPPYVSFSSFVKQESWYLTQG